MTVANSSERSSRSKRRVIALLLGLLSAPLAIEGMYRALRSSGLSPTTNPAYVEHDPRLGWHYRPGTRERHVGREFDVGIEINSRGFRGPEWDLTTTGDRARRILVLGDSFAFGWGVEHAESVPARLAASRPDWRVFGAGVSGYATDQESLLLDDLDDLVRPDCVVVVFCENDLYECTQSDSYGKRKPRFVRSSNALQLEGVPVPFPWIERVSHAWRALRKARWEREFAHRARDPNVEWALVCDLLRRMAERLAGRPLVIVSAEARLAQFAADETGIEHVDLREAFGENAPQFHFVHDGHWNATGHARAAEALERALRPLIP